jgi:hypothetical protein
MKFVLKPVDVYKLQSIAIGTVFIRDAPDTDFLPDIRPILKLVAGYPEQAGYRISNRIFHSK